MPNYNGQIIEVPVGIVGLHTDDPNSALQAGNLIVAKNLNFQNGAVEKAPGSMRWNNVALSTGIKGAFDWWPNDTVQRIIAMGANGSVYRFTDPATASVVNPTGSAPNTLNTSQAANMVAGGNEDINNPRKLFLMTGYDPIQVISGDATTRYNISGPVSDFGGTNYPAGGLIFRGRLFVFLRNSSTIYASSALDHEDFASLPLPYNAFPGESERIVDAFSFRSKLFVLKYPRGLYVMVDDDADPQNWYFQKINGSFGGSNFRCAVPVFDDAYIGNEYGGLTSLTATNATGDVTSSDIFASLRIQGFVRQFLSQDGRNVRQGIYYPDKRIAMWIYQGRSSTQNNWILNLDFSQPQAPKAVWYDKDQANCLFLMKDVTGVERPFYGANDGFLYRMDSSNYWVGSADGVVENGYLYEWQTPHLDLSMGVSQLGTSMGNPQSGDSNKNWEFLQLVYEPTGRWNLAIDVYLDGIFHKTLQFEVGGRSDLDFVHTDVGTTSSEVEVTTMLPIQGMGKRISFRAYDNTPGHNFKITKLRVYYKMSGQQDRK